MPNFDRFDICEAYYALDVSWNSDGMIEGRKKAISGQLHNVQFKPAMAFNGFESLTENGKEIYAGLCERYGFKDEDAERFMKGEEDEDTAGDS